MCETKEKSFAMANATRTITAKGIIQQWYKSYSDHVNAYKLFQLNEDVDRILCSPVTQNIRSHIHSFNYFTTHTLTHDRRGMTTFQMEL